MDGDALDGEIRRRSKRRTPALTWRHPASGTPLARSAQPHSADHGDRAVNVVAGAAGPMIPSAAKDLINDHVTSKPLPGHGDCLGAIRRCGLVGSSLAIVDVRPRVANGGFTVTSNAPRS